MRAVRHRLTILAVVFGTILGMTAWAPSAGAGVSDSHRGMKWQFSIPLTFTSGASIDGDNGTGLDVSDDLGWGFSFGYNLNEKLLLGMDLTWLSANYNATITVDNDNNGIADGTASLSGILDASNLQFFAQYNFMAKNVTPFVRGSFGSTWVDSNIPSGAPSTGCWWDPWYGYICTTWQPTFEDTSFSYGLAAGVRGELTPQFFLEGSYNILWIDFSKDTQSFDGFRFNIGWSF